jgi:hypothetical protein
MSPRPLEAIRLAVTDSFRQARLPGLRVHPLFAIWQHLDRCSVMLRTRNQHHRPIMRSEFILYGIWALGTLAAISFGFQALKNRGLKGAIFGAPIGRTVGELALGKIGPMSTMLKVHRLESRGPGTPAIGIELVNRSLVSYHMTPIPLTSQQASALKELLSRAVAENQGYTIRP